MITLTKDLNEAKFVTHAGNFHADDVFGTVFMEKLHGDITVIRLKNYMDDGTKITYDIGLGKFDHHQAGFDKKRENGIHYCGFGLLWKEYGLEYLKKIKVDEPKTTYEIFDYLLVNMIDAIDNGEFDIHADFNVYTLSHLIELFRPSFLSNEDEDECFKKACDFASTVFDLVLRDSICKTAAMNIVKEKAKTMKDKILILDEMIPYEFAIFKLGLDVNFVIFPSNRGGYASHTVPTFYRGFVPKIRFPEAWAGLRDEELASVSNIPSARFCHNKRFLFTCDTFEDAIKAAEIASGK